MPKVDGFDLLKFVESKAVLRRIPLIILTSSNEPTDREKARELGADLYLVKPTKFDDLADIAKRLHTWAKTVATKSPEAQMRCAEQRIEELVSASHLSQYDECGRWALEWICESQSTNNRLASEITTMKKAARHSTSSSRWIDLKLLDQCEWSNRNLWAQWVLVKQNANSILRQIASFTKSARVSSSFRAYLLTAIKTSLRRNQHRIRRLTESLEFVDAKVSRIKARLNQRRRAGIQM